MPFSLLHPGLFAFGVACVSIPIILHLLKRKRRPIPWGAMRFLEQAYRKRRRILTIEQLILLILRCALLVLLALGAGSLMLGSGATSKVSTTMVIVIDNSIGSALVDNDHTSLDRNKQFALRAIDELDQLRGDTAMLIAGGSPVRGMVVPQSSDITAVRAMIESIEPTDSAFDLSASLALADMMDRDPERPTRTALVIATSARGLNPTQDSATSTLFDRVIALTPETMELENIGIESAIATRSLVTQSGVTLPMGVRVGLVRSGSVQETSSTIQIKSQDGTLLGTRTIRWQPGQQSTSVVIGIATDPIKPMHARTAAIQVSIDDDLNDRDNNRMLSLPTRSIIRVGVIDRPASQIDTVQFTASRWIRAVLAPDDRFGISILDIDARRAAALIAPNLDAIVVLSPGGLDSQAWDRIIQLNQQGALVVIAPGADPGSLTWIDQIESIAPAMIQSGSVLHQYDAPISILPDQTIPQASLLAGLATEFDQLAKTVTIEQSIRLNPGDQSNTLAVLSDGSPLGLQSTPSDAKGMVVVLGIAIDLEWTSLPARPMFVPMMQEIIREGVGNGSMNPMIEAGSRVPTQPWVTSSRRLLTNQSQSTPVSPDDTSIEGIIAQLDAQGTTRALVMINPDSQGAITDPIPQETVNESIKGLTNADAVAWFDSSIDGEPTIASPNSSNTGPLMLQSSAPGVSIALWLILAAGVVAMLEMILAKLFTVSVVESTSRAGGAA